MIDALEQERIVENHKRTLKDLKAKRAEITNDAISRGAPTSEAMRAADVEIIKLFSTVVGRSMDDAEQKYLGVS